MSMQMLNCKFIHSKHLLMAVEFLKTKIQQFFFHELIKKTVLVTFTHTHTAHLVKTIVSCKQLLFLMMMT